MGRTWRGEGYSRWTPSALGWEPVRAKYVSQRLPPPTQQFPHFWGLWTQVLTVIFTSRSGVTIRLTGENVLKEEFS